MTRKLNQLVPYYCEDGITIYCGDCRDVLPLIKASILVTDPPYGIGFAGQPTKWQRRAGAEARTWDDEIVEEVVSMAGLFETSVIWGGNHYPLPVSRGWLCWTKPDAPPSIGTFELAWTNRDENTSHMSCTISSTNKERVGHPTQKPLRIMSWTLSKVPTTGIIVDPFMGSGTTLVAAKAMGRQIIGIDIDEAYCEMAVERLRQSILPFMQ